MPEGSGKGVEERLAKLGKDILWLRVALILALVVLALVAVAVLQMRDPVAKAASEQVSPATRAVGAGQFTLLEKLDRPKAPAAKDTGEVEKTRVRAQLCLRDGVARLDLLDDKGEVVWSTTWVPATKPPAREGPAAKEPAKE